ncbi:MAG: hypothetical protein M3Z15_02535, partial [Pseudomonadota bacterium]|nr:hypothetical protein [Pseudomonadota bacterium]
MNTNSESPAGRQAAPEPGRAPTGGSAAAAAARRDRAAYRPLPLGGSLEADFTRRADGATLVVSREPLAP